MKSLLINTQMVDTFTKFINRNYYNNSNIQDLMIKAIIDKINDNNINFDDSPLNNIEFIGAWLVSFSIYFDDYLKNKKKLRLRYWENVYNKSIRENKNINWTVEDKIKNFKVDTAILEKDNCLQICSQILNTKFLNNEKDRLSHLFLKICSYVFSDDIFFSKDEVINFEYNNLSNVYFLYLKETIDLCVSSYNKKVEINKAKKNETVSK